MNSPQSVKRTLERSEKKVIRKGKRTTMGGEDALAKSRHTAREPGGGKVGATEYIAGKKVVKETGDMV